MQPALTIGEFSRMTHLSVKTLRHYHEVGLLEPAEVDPSSGYRYYRTAQVPTAQVIRRLRDLEMPIEQVGAVLVAGDLETRNALIAAHLQRMEDQLEQTRTAVASLRALVESPAAPVSVEHREVGAVRAVAIRETVAQEELADWWAEGFAELRALVAENELAPNGPPGGLFAGELFEQELGEAILFIPVDGRTPSVGRARSLVIAPGELAIAVHAGSHADVDRTYGALGTHVAEHAIGVEGHVRERYLVSRLDTPDASKWRTEIGWPIFQTADGTAQGADAPSRGASAEDDAC
jgi:DNA-binding transcriptional MerR regulator